jgi:hypothetical protein
VPDAVGIDPQRDHAAAALQIDPVERHDREAQPIERRLIRSIRCARVPDAN